jgi:hypothetical protein
MSEANMIPHDPTANVNMSGSGMSHMIETRPEVLKKIMPDGYKIMLQKRIYQVDIIGGN